MSALERICPNCGTSNSPDRTYCVRCNTNLITLAARGQKSLPAHLNSAQAAGLVLGVSALVARAGLGLITRQILPRLVDQVAGRRGPLARREPVSDDQPDYIVRGWRAWSVHDGEQHSSGSEQFEWRIKRNK